MKFLLSPPLILLFLQTEQSTIKTAHINFMIKKEYALVFVFFEFVTRHFENFKTCRKLKRCPTNVPNAGRGEGVPSEANLCRFLDVPNSLGREGVSKLWDNVPKFTLFFILKASLTSKTF